MTSSDSGIILVLGRSGDTCLDAVARQLSHNGETFVRVIQRVTPGVTISASPAIPEGLNSILVDGQTIAIDDIRSIYARQASYIDLAEETCDQLADDDTTRLECEDALLASFLDSFPRLVINRPKNQHYSYSKLGQLVPICHAGFKVPETLITNSPAEVIRFTSSHVDSIFKSISSVRSIVHSVDSTVLEQLDLLATCPVQFQERVFGDTYRVHVVGDQAYCSRIESTAVDYRYPGVEGDTFVEESAALDPLILNQSVALTASLGLSLSGVDIIVEPDGDAVCLEVNSNPSFAYVGDDRITAEIARLLAHPT